MTGQEGHGKGTSGQEKVPALGRKQSLVQEGHSQGKPYNGLNLLEMAGITESHQVAGDLKTQCAKQGRETFHVQDSEKTIHESPGQHTMHYILEIERQGKREDQKQPRNRIKRTKGKGANKRNSRIQIRQPTEQEPLPQSPPTEGEQDVIMMDGIESIKKNPGLKHREIQKEGSADEGGSRRRMP